MSNRRRDRQLPEGFIRFTGEYEKRWYDVLTFNGVVYKAVWPNAGMWSIPNGRFLKENDVLAVRPLPNPYRPEAGDA